MHYSLDNITSAFYSKNLKTSKSVFAAVIYAIFLYLPIWRMRAENNQYQPKHICLLLVSPPPLKFAWQF